MFRLNFSSGFHIKAQAYFLRTHCAVTIYLWKTGKIGRIARIRLSVILRLYPWTSQMNSDFNGWTENGLKCICSKQTEHVYSATQLHGKYKWPTVFTEAKGV